MTESIHADCRETVRISTRRFEQSPYLPCYDNPFMVRGVYAGRFYPITNGDDPERMYWALRRKAALYDVPERPVEISGPDAVAFMERVFARRIGTLREGRGRYAVACTPGGGVFIDGLLFRLSDARFWYVQPDGALEAWLIAHSAGYDVTISDPASRVLQVQGPNSFAIMHEASNGAIDESMKYFHSGWFNLGGQALYVSRSGWTGELGYEIYSEGGRTDHRRLWEHLTTVGERHGMVFSSASSMEIRRIEAGILDNITDMDMTMTPFQAGLERVIDMDKEGFVGREALLEADRRPLLHGVRCPAGTPAMNGGVFTPAGERIGRITAGAWTPYLECGIGYVRLFEPRDRVGERHLVEVREGVTGECEIVTLPFYDPEKRIARGLDVTVP